MRGVMHSGKKSYPIIFLDEIISHYVVNSVIGFNFEYFLLD